ncbi:MAG: hypothetical protein IJG68_00760 [Bacilli bacterium]|nr:hypothetical protein [Bacilli bacterium]
MKKSYKKDRQRLTKTEKKKRKINQTINLILRALVVLSMISQILNHNWNNVLLCIFTLILFTLPEIISKTVNITIPTTLEISVYLFIFASAFLGEVQNFYEIFTHWDTILHTLNGFLCAAIGFSLIDTINHNEDYHINMSPAFAALVAFSFSMTVGVVWEFAEYSADQYLGKDMQKDKIIQEFQSIKINETGENIPIPIKDINKTELYNSKGEKILTVEGGYLDIGIHDTMKDLIVNFIGAFVFSIFGYLYTKNKEGYRFLEIILFKTNKSSQKLE